MKNFSKISIIVVLVLIFSAGAVFLSLQPEDYGPCQWMNGVSGCRPKDEKVGLPAVGRYRGLRQWGSICQKF